MSEAELMGRLEKLERDNRRLKQGSFALLVMLVALTTIYATRPVPDVIKAHVLEAVDDAGNVRVAVGKIDAPNVYGEKLYYRTGHAAMTLFAGQGVIDYDRRTLKPAFAETSSLSLLGPKGGLPQAIIAAGPGGPGFSLFGSTYRGSVNLQISAKGSPLMQLEDPQGFEMALGSTGTVNGRTGQTQQTSADSIIMFGNDEHHRVIWQAP